MPELPEVETIVRGLKKKVIGRTITDLWTDWWKYFRLNPMGSISTLSEAPRSGAESKGYNEIRKHLIGKKIINITRRAKNILFHLSDDHLLLVHQKLSGHLMVGKWERKTQKLKIKSQNLGAASRRIVEKWKDSAWMPSPFKGPLTEPTNRFLRLIFFLDDGNMIGFSDIRRFGKVLCGPRELIMSLPDLKNLGPEPLEKTFTLEKFEKLIKNKKSPIKQLLLDQTFVVGIGNIYADEILWHVKLHPLTKAENLNSKKIKELYTAIKNILTHAVKLRGSSVGDYRDAEGREGSYEKFHNVYQKTNSPCSRCKAPIKRIKTGVRSSHFCPKCQTM